MAVLATLVTVGTTAVALPSSALGSRASLTVRSQRWNTQVVYLGGSAVTADAATTGGFMLAPGQVVTVEAAAAVLYARSTSAGQLVEVLERG